MQNEVDLLQRRCHDRHEVVGNSFKDRLGCCLLGEIVAAFKTKGHRKQSVRLSLNPLTL